MEILVKIGELKEMNDRQLSSLLNALDRFDRTVAEAVVDTQATRSINKNYELSYQQYLKRENRNFNEAIRNAGALIADCENGNRSACNRYKLVKTRIKRMEERKKLYALRVDAAKFNQKMSENIRNLIKEKGREIPWKLRNTLSKLYIAYSKVVPIASTVYQGKEPFSIPQLEKLSYNFEVMEDAAEKLASVVDGLVSDVIKGWEEKYREFGPEGKVASLTGRESINTQEELEWLENMKNQWEGGK